MSINKEQTTIIVLATNPKKAIMEAGYQRHPAGKGFIRPIAGNLRFHAYLIKPDRIEIHLDKTVHGHHRAVMNDYFFGEMDRVQNIANQHFDRRSTAYEHFRQQNEEKCKKYIIDLKATVKEMVKLQMKPLPNWFPKKLQNWLVAKLINIKYEQ